MFKKTITYFDFNGDSQTETLYFNLSTSEFFTIIQELNGDDLDSIVNTGDVTGMLRVLQNFILDSYGEKSVDGKRFVKNDTIRSEFSQSAAYDALIEDLVQNVDSASEFIKGLIPASLSNAMAKRGITFDSISDKIQNGNMSDINSLRSELVLNSNLSVVE